MGDALARRRLGRHCHRRDRAHRRRRLRRRAAARWISGHLFVAIEVYDERHELVTPDAWRGDSIQIAIDPLATGGLAYDADDREWTISESGVEGEGLRASVVRGARSTIYEMALEGLSIEADAVVRASFLANENDGVGREGFLGIGLSMEPEAFGEIVISPMDALPPGVDAGTRDDDAGVSDGGIDPPSGGCGCRW